MPKLSKSTKLGVIILALSWLGKLGFSVPRLVSAVALALGVSRKSGYLAARRIDAILRKLSAEHTEGNLDGDLNREVLVLRIRNQVLTYERDHPGVRFAERRRHLPEEAKSLCVRILRDFRAQLSESAIAAALEVPLSSLRRWESEAEPGCGFPQKPERRGVHRRAGPEDVERVVQEWRSLKDNGQSCTLEEFTEKYREKYPDKPLDRRTITKILQGEGLLEVHTRGSEPERYHEPVQIYFPGAQAAVDATKCQVSFPNGTPETVTVTKEVAQDIATGAVLGDAVGKEETSEGVKRVLVRAREECRWLLAVLSDNGSANRAAVIEEELGEAGVEQIFTFPYHPETNGHIEGFFGQFSRIVGKIEIDDSSRVAIAYSVVEVIFRIYVYFHNHSPRKRLGGLSPQEYLRRYTPSVGEVEEARERLKRRNGRSRTLRKRHPRLSDASFQELVRGILERNRLQAPFEKALEALLPYDRRVIQNSSNAFFTQSQRDGFDERKRTFAYFMGIVRKKQKEIDNARLRDELERQEAQRRREEYDARTRALQREKAQEQEDLKTRPERVVLQYAELLLSGQLRLMRRTWQAGLREGVRALGRLGRATARTLEELSMTIRSWGKFAEELKEDMVQLLRAEFKRLSEQADPDC
jgi:transposase InsO family protein